MEAPWSTAIHQGGNRGNQAMSESQLWVVIGLLTILASCVQVPRNYSRQEIYSGLEGLVNSDSGAHTAVPDMGHGNQQEVKNAKSAHRSNQ